MIAGLQKINATHDLQALSASPSESHHLADQESDTTLTEQRDRKLRNQIILINAAAWVVIGMVFSYFFL